MSNVNVQKLYDLTGHKGSIYTIEKGMNPNECISGAGDGMVVLWNQKEINQGLLLAKVPGSVYALLTIKEESLLVVGQNNEGLHFIDLKTNKEAFSIKITDQSIFDIKEWNGFLLVACGKGEFIIVDYKKRVVVEKLILTDKNLRSISIAPNQEECVIGCSDSSLKVVSFKTLKVMKEILGHTLSVFTVTHTSDSNYLISGARDAQIKLWSVKEDYKEVKSIAAHMYPVNHISFDPTEQYFASCSMDKTIKIWETKSLKLLKVIDKVRHQGHSNSINKLFWSEAGQLMSCSDDRTISHWELEFNL